MVTATIVSFDGTDSAAAKTQLEALAPTTATAIVTWHAGHRVYVAKITNYISG